MKKSTITLLMLFLISGVTLAQSYKPMNGYYQFNGNIKYNGTSYIDSSTLDIPTGLALILDTVGMSETGYARVTSGASGVSNIKGSGSANQVTYWAAADSIASASSVTLNQDSGSMTITPIGNTGLTLVGAKDINTGGSIISTRDGFKFQSKLGVDINFAPEGDKVMQIDKDLITIGTDSNVNLTVTSDATTPSLYVLRDGEGSVGVGTVPSGAKLHVKGSVLAPDVILRLDNGTESTPDISALSLNNGPAGITGDPAKYLKVSINGTIFVFPLWQLP